VEKFHEKQKQREELIAMKEQQEEIKLAEQRKHNCYEAIQKVVHHCCTFTDHRLSCYKKEYRNFLIIFVHLSIHPLGL
jgi:hypothetical protein